MQFSKGVFIEGISKIEFEFIGKILIEVNAVISLKR